MLDIPSASSNPLAAFYLLSHLAALAYNRTALQLSNRDHSLILDLARRGSVIGDCPPNARHAANNGARARDRVDKPEVE